LSVLDGLITTISTSPNGQAVVFPPPDSFSAVGSTTRMFIEFSIALLHAPIGELLGAAAIMED
jgi:hypothetical protein